MPRAQYLKYCPLCGGTGRAGIYSLLEMDKQSVYNNNGELKPLNEISTAIVDFHEDVASECNFCNEKVLFTIGDIEIDGVKVVDKVQPQDILLADGMLMSVTFDRFRHIEYTSSQFLFGKRQVKLEEARFDNPISGVLMIQNTSGFLLVSDGKNINTDPNPTTIFKIVIKTVIGDATGKIVKILAGTVTGQPTTVSDEVEIYFDLNQVSHEYQVKSNDVIVRIQTPELEIKFDLVLVSTSIYFEKNELPL